MHFRTESDKLKTGLFHEDVTESRQRCQSNLGSGQALFLLRLLGGLGLLVGLFGGAGPGCV